MKDKILTITRSLAVLLALTLLCSLLFSALYYFHVISQMFFHMLNWIFGAISFGIAGVILGLGINKKALLHAFMIAVILAVPGFLMMNVYSIINVIEFISKLSLYICGSILALNMKNKT